MIRIVSAGSAHSGRKSSERLNTERQGPRGEGSLQLEESSWRSSDTICRKGFVEGVALLLDGCK